MGDLSVVFKKYWYHIILGVLLAILTILQLIKVQISVWWIFGMVLVYAAINTYKDVSSDEREKTMSNTLSGLLSSSKNKDEVIKGIDKKLEEAKRAMDEFLMKKQGAIELLNHLINKGIIDEEDINKHLESSELTTLFCYATAFPKLKEGKKSLKLPKRLYPGFLEQNLLFIRMGKRASFFVVLTKRLPRELQNTIVLKNYLLKKFDDLFKEEYSIFLGELEKEDMKKYLKKYKEVPYNDVLKMSILIVKGKLSENNIGFLHEQTFYKRFLDLVKGEIDFKKINLPQFKKIKVRNYVLDSSCELLLFELPKEDLEKLTGIEADLKKELDIKKITDYCTKNEDDIKKVLLKTFPEEKAIIYSRGLKKRAEDYKKALRDLGVSLD